MQEEFTSFDIGAIVASIALFAGYHIHLYIVKPQCFGGQVPFAINMKNADMWIMKHKEMSESPTILLAIQTLRNTMMAAVFIGGNAINFAYDLGNNYSDLKDKPLRVRSLVIMTLMFASFLCWANVIRLCSVLGYLIGTMQYSEKLRMQALERERQLAESKGASTETSPPPSPLDETQHGTELDGFTDTSSASNTATKRKNKSTGHEYKHVFSIDKEQCSPEDIPNIFEEGSKMMKLVTVYFSFGFRLMFVSIPFAFYSAGPIALVISSVCMFLFLHSYDHARHHTVK